MLPADTSYKKHKWNYQTESKWPPESNLNPHEKTKNISKGSYVITKDNINVYFLFF